MPDETAYAQTFAYSGLINGITIAIHELKEVVEKYAKATDELIIEAEDSLKELT